jgi:glycolate oxidase iron-sulfur subunit
MAASDFTVFDKPQTIDLDKCVHCGLCLNACPTYRELHVEMDSPRGRIYQMAQVASGAAPINESYIEHIDLCLACRACETACPSGVQYGRLVEAARAEIENSIERPWIERFTRWLVFRHLLPSRTNLRIVGRLLWLYQASGLRRAVRASGMLKRLGRWGELEALSPAAETPFFYRYYGKVFPAEGEQRYRVALLGGCIANISFARLHEATVRVLQKNGCEVSIPAEQTCCGALHVHAGIRGEARRLARINIDALLAGIDAVLAGNFDAVLSNTSGCGSNLKEYGDLLEHDPEYAGKARRFSSLVQDINEFLASIPLNQNLGPVPAVVTYQDSCHLAHGQKIRSAPRRLLHAIPGLEFREMPLSDVCCGSAGIYNVQHTEMSMAILESKMMAVDSTHAEVVVTANPGCILQLRAGEALFGSGRRVAHVVEILDESYANFRA